RSCAVMADPIADIEHDAVLVGKLARHFDQLGLTRGTEVLMSVERELTALANERRAAQAVLPEATASVEKLRAECRALADAVAATIRRVTGPAMTAVRPRNERR